MRHWWLLLRYAHTHLLIIFAAILSLSLAAFAGAMIAMRGTKRPHGQRHRGDLYAPERESFVAAPVSKHPLVLSRRWVGRGLAATTADGGCLVFIDNVSPLQHTAFVSLRIDGLPAVQGHGLTIGEYLEATGKSGTYLVQLCAAEPSRACIEVTLKNKHSPT